MVDVSDVSTISMLYDIQILVEGSTPVFIRVVFKFKSLPCPSCSDFNHTFAITGGAPMLVACNTELHHNTIRQLAVISVLEVLPYSLISHLLLYSQISIKHKDTSSSPSICTNI